MSGPRACPTPRPGVWSTISAPSSIPLPLLVVHDFDKSGFSIVGTLQRATRRYTFKNDLRVIDIGLRLADVDAYDLQTEPSTDVGDGDIATLRLNGASGEEIYLLRQVRVELNAFTSDQFVAWLEGKLNEHGITKVVPDDAALELAYRRSLAAAYFEDHAHDLIKAARKHAVAADLPLDLRSRMEEALKTDPARPWDAVVRGSLAMSERLSQGPPSPPASPSSCAIPRPARSARRTAQDV